MRNKLKSILILAFLLFAAGFVKAQDNAEWKEMVEFHKVMSQTFHPLEKEIINLFANAAVKWL